MKTFSSGGVLIAGLVVATACSQAEVADEPTPPAEITSAAAAQADSLEPQACDMLFVQESQGMTYDGTTLTLIDANPDIIFFCDRPVREAGHMSKEAFISLVSEGVNTFASNPPNAAVSIFGGEGEVTEVVVALNGQPSASEVGINFPVEILEGELPAEGGAVAMFIDPIGRPLSPTSAAGVHRRHRRRAIRRH